MIQSSVNDSKNFVVSCDSSVTDGQITDSERNRWMAAARHGVRVSMRCNGAMRLGNWYNGAFYWARICVYSGEELMYKTEPRSACRIVGGDTARVA